MSTPLVSVIIINWNTRNLLPLCLETLRTAAGELPYDVWVVDNASCDGSVEMLRTHFPEVHVIVNATNAGFAAANNQAMNVARGEFFLLLNSDAVLKPGALDALIAVARGRPRAGIVGGRLLNPDGSFQASFTRFPTLAREALILSTLGVACMDPGTRPPGLRWRRARSGLTTWKGLACSCGAALGWQWARWMRATGCTPKRSIGVAAWI